jgi:drug/metabolite transporter (DMT)-like permease
MAIFPAALAYTFWDRGMRTGNFVLLASASYFAPILGTLWMVIYLQVPARPPLWIGCGLVTAGAFICRFSFVENRPSQ